MPRFSPAGATQTAQQPTRTAMPTMPAMPEWGPAEPTVSEWDLPPVVSEERLVYEAPPSGFESAPPPMAPRAFATPPQAQVQPPPPAPAPAATTAPAPQPSVFIAADFTANPTLDDLFGQPSHMPPPAAPGPANPTRTLDDLFAEPSHMPPPAAPGPATPYAFLPPPRAADVAQPAPVEETYLDQDFDSDPEMTMIASRRGKTKFWTLDLPDGSVEVVVGCVIVGRSASPIAGRTGARLLSIEDPTRSVSKNHAVFTDENGVLLVEDLGSMNGVVVTRADGHETELSPGIRLRLDHGSTVELGDMLLTVYKN